jgi:hypothetical protein
VGPVSHVSDDCTVQSTAEEPLPSPAGSSHRRARLELWIIPHTPAMDATEERLSNALLVVIGGARPVVSSALVLAYLGCYFQVMEHEVRVVQFIAIRMISC